MNAIFTPAQIHFYKENGYLIVENFLEEKEIEALQVSAREIVNGFEMSSISVFTTEEQSQHTDRYFLESGHQVRCFFEPEALDEQNNLKIDKHLAINKIGHAMHDIMPVWEKISYRSSLYAFAKAIGHSNPAIVQSQYIYKQPQIGGQVHAHTDSTFINTKPLSCIGAWVALEDADQDNGCLLAIPGSHKWPLQNLFIRSGTENKTELIPTNNNKALWDEDRLIPLEVKKGTLVLLDGSVVHASSPNRSTRSRHAFVLHLADLDCEWPDYNWLQRPVNMPFRSMANNLLSFS